MSNRLRENKGGEYKRAVLLRPEIFLLFSFADLIFYYIVRYMLIDDLGLLYSFKIPLVNSFLIMGIVFLSYSMSLYFIKFENYKKSVGALFRIISGILIFLFCCEIYIFAAFSLSAYQHQEISNNPILRKIPSE